MSTTVHVKTHNLHNNETNEDFYVRYTDTSRVIGSIVWYPSEFEVPQDAWNEFIAHPMGGEYVDKKECLWHWKVGDYAVISREKISRMSNGIKNVVKIPKQTWERMLSLE